MYTEQCDIFTIVCSIGFHFDIFDPCLKTQGSLSFELGELPNSGNSGIPGGK